MTDIGDEIPAGYEPVQVRTTYLEMLRDEAPVAPATPEGCSVRRWHNAPLDEYRALFLAVGREWGWTGRLLLSDEELRALLDKPSTEVYRLTCHGRIAGFGELERRPGGEVEIVYFGLMPEFIGRGLGGFLLRWIVNRAWQAAEGGEPTRRLWLHTCDFDHPGARAFYRHAGFQVYDETVGPELYPSAFLAKTTRPRLTTERTGEEPSQ
jgi:GNAT superfamily N-acetyltransferase